MGAGDGGHRGRMVLAALRGHGEITRKASPDIPAHPASRAVHLNGGMSTRVPGFTKTIR